MTLVEGKDICVHLDGRLVLDRVNISVNKGEIVTLIGPNGSGKSTLIRCIIGSVLASSGSLRRQSGIIIGYVPQKLMIDGTFPITVERFLNLPKASSGANIDKALSDTGVLSLKNRNVTTLSGGQFQRVMLARALLNNPDLLILDEPTQGMDQPAATAFYTLIESIKNTLGCGILLVSHELNVVMAASNRVICLNGHICCQGTPDHVATTPEYKELFGPLGDQALALYRHKHDHSHSHEDAAH